MTGASDDDPAGIGTYVQAGAQFGYLQLWTVLITFPAMAAMQEMCGRIGEVTGQGLAAVIRNNYARPVLFFIIFIQVVTNTVNIGADLSAMAESARLLWHVSYLTILAVTALSTTALIVLVPYRAYSVYLKILGLSLLTYVASAFLVHVDWHRVLSSMFVPHFELSKNYILTLIAVFGVTISPYEFFWQSNEEVEELVAKGKLAQEEADRPVTSRKDVASLRTDTIFGMFFANAVAFFIMITAAATLNAHGLTNVGSAAEAAQALRPMAGSLTFAVFALGIVSAGLLAIPVMAGSSAYAVAGAFGWKRSLSKPFWQEPRFYGVIIASCGIGLLVNLAHIPPFKLLYYAGVLNGVISPPLLFIVTQISSNAKIMGEFKNSRIISSMGWALCGFMTLALIAFFVL